VLLAGHRLEGPGPTAGTAGYGNRNTGRANESILRRGIMKAKDLNLKAIIRAFLEKTRPIEQLESGDFNLRKN